MFKTIIVHVDDSPMMEARLQATATLAATCNAHVVGAAATGISWPAYAMLTGVATAAMGDDYESLRMLARTNLGRFATRARQLGVDSLEERLVENENRDALLLHSRYADLVVVSLHAPDTSGVQALPQYLALHGVRPVLVVPPSYAGQPVGATIMVGWDGSAPALRAIAAALPLLVQARTVKLALINPESEGALHGAEPGADMAHYLARHGVPVEVLRESGAQSVGDTLLGLAQAAGADLLVSGAFGHSRFREIVLGGVTRVLLERATLPLLLAH